MSHDAARLISARLIREGALHRGEIDEIEHPEVRREVEERLRAVGLTLATSAYSEHVGLRLSPEVLGDQAFDSATNLGLRKDACALLVVLWSRLVLQKRTATDSHQAPGPGQLFAGDAADASREFVPSVMLEALAREFKDVFRSRSRLKGLVTQLRRLGFAAGRGERIEAGPLLELGIDGEAMVAFIRRGVLSRLLEESREEAKDLPPSPTEQVLGALAARGGDCSIAELEEETGLPRPRLRALLKELAEDQQVRKVGERATTRYQLVSPPDPDHGEEE